MRKTNRSGSVGLAVAVLVFVYAGVSLAAVKGEAARARPSVLHPTWTAIATRGDQLTADDGRYQLWASVKHPARATLISDRTGKRTVLSRAGCSADLLSLPWVVFDCGTSDELYAPSDGTWRAVTLAPSIVILCPPESSNGPHGLNCSISPESIGRDWIEFYVDPLAASGYGLTYAYQNLKTGEVVENGANTPNSGAPATATTSIDLDSPSLTGAVCAPLQNPQEGTTASGQPIYGSLFFFGPYTIVGMTLERCGSLVNTQLPLPSGVATYSNAKIIVWQATLRTLHAILLPSLSQSRLTMPAPVNTAVLHALVLSPTRLYIQGRSRAWSTPMPADK